LRSARATQSETRAKRAWIPERSSVSGVHHANARVSVVKSAAAPPARRSAASKRARRAASTARAKPGRRRSVVENATTSSGR
jgi:hypothetical protein